MDDYVGAKVTLNGKPLWGMDANGCLWTVSSLEGMWDGAGSSHEHSALAWGDGWVSNRSFLGGREITITGKVQSPDDESYLAARQSLMAAIPVESGDLTVTVAGRAFLFRVQRAQARPLVKQLAGLRVVEYSIPLVSKSPYAFDAGDPLSGSTGLAATSGGMRFPSAFTSPGAPGLTSSWCFSEATVSGTVFLVNPGGAPSPVTLRVDGPVVDPRIEHQPSGSVLELGMTFGAGHCVVFDSQSRQVLVDGRDPARGAVLRRGWSDAPPGQNSWSFTAKEFSESARITVSFRAAYL